MGRYCSCRIQLVVLLILFAFIQEQECRGGRVRGGHRPSSSSSSTSYKSHGSPADFSYPKSSYVQPARPPKPVEHPHRQTDSHQTNSHPVGPPVQTHSQAPPQPGFNPAYTPNNQHNSWATNTHIGSPNNNPHNPSAPPLPNNHPNPGSTFGTQNNAQPNPHQGIGFDKINKQVAQPTNSQAGWATGSHNNNPHNPSAPPYPNNHPNTGNTFGNQNNPHNPAVPPYPNNHPNTGNTFGNQNNNQHYPNTQHGIGFDKVNKQASTHQTNTQPGWVLPPKPGAHNYYPTNQNSIHSPHPQGPPVQSNGYYPYQSYHNSHTQNGPQKVKVVNNYNYHYPGYYSPPQTHAAYPGYYFSTPSYHYSSFDTGSTALGFALGYGLAKITTPTYAHQSFYDGYRPRYDHYEVHHYYHNRDSIPKTQEINSNSIVGCIGDTPQVCPANTTSLCTASGALMCVVSATSTVPCTDNRQMNCVRSQISCLNNNGTECKNAKSDTISINIPCIQTAKIEGELKVLDNTIVPKIQNVTIAANSTSTVSSLLSTQYPITTTPNPSKDISTQYPITTTPNSESGSKPAARKRRDVAAPVQNYCVTVLALPAAKKETEGEKLFKDAQDVVGKFFEKAFGL